MKRFVLVMFFILFSITFSGCANTEKKQVSLNNRYENQNTTKTYLYEIKATTPVTMPVTSEDTQTKTKTTTTKLENKSTTTVNTTKITTTKVTTTTKVKKTETTTKTTKPTTTTTYKKPVIPKIPDENEFFNDAIFIGDSVTLKLKLYSMKENSKGRYPLGNATFFTAGSFSWTNSLWDLSNPKAVHPTLNGQKMHIAQAISASGSKKAYIMLGINDLSYGIEKSIKNVIKNLNDIDKNCPGVEIYIESVTPIYKGRERGSINNKNVHAFNEKLKEICQERGYHYIDINTSMGKDSLLPEFCSDKDSMGIHFTDSACKVWIDTLIKNQ